MSKTSTEPPGIGPATLFPYPKRDGIKRTPSPPALK